MFVALFCLIFTVEKCEPPNEPQGQPRLRQAQVAARSPPRNCSHEAFPFVEAPAKAKLAGSIETQPGDHLAALSAFRIVDVPIIAPTGGSDYCVRSESL
jgi:hypothetical protein